VPVGGVGEISFWAPNRGLLITGGTAEPLNPEPGKGPGPVAAGLYAYNGEEWHQLATVCGGADGRIAWAGPDEFWTISDQRTGQSLAGRNTYAAMFESLSLCHFLNGEVVGSYAMPLQLAGSYVPMDSAACYGPSDCWFGGQDGSDGSESGAFHLHWDGSTVTAVYETGAGPITDMVDFDGEIFESVRVGGPANSHPSILHTIASAGSPPPLFSGLPIVEAATSANSGRRPLPVYGSGVSPGILQGFALATDGSAAGEDATQLWAAADPVEWNAGSVTVLHDVLHHQGNAWSQVIPGPNGSLPPAIEGKMLTGASAYLGGSLEEPAASETIAPEPGSEDAWISLHSRGGNKGAEVALLGPDGTIAEDDVLPSSQEPVGFRGQAGPIVCPAPHDCWMATNKGADPLSNEETVPGWLFHLTDGTRYPRDTDPSFAGVITSRPPDSGVPVVYPDAPPVDNSLANQQPPPAPSGPPVQILEAPPGGTTPAVAPVQNVHGRLVRRRTFVLSFTLRIRAHVQLIARRKGVVVARSHAESLRPGPHTLSLLLDPRRWPTGFQLKTTPIGAAAPLNGGAGGAGSNDTISTG
jgi:hypothetical protein